MTSKDPRTPEWWRGLQSYSKVGREFYHVVTAVIDLV
jgi:hypothetical protein